MIITIDIPQELIDNNVKYGDSSLDITLDTKFLHKSTSPCGKIATVWTNEDGYRELKFSIINP